MIADLCEDFVTLERRVQEPKHTKQRVGSALETQSQSIGMIAMQQHCSEAGSY